MMRRNDDATLLHMTIALMQYEPPHIDHNLRLDSVVTTRALSRSLMPLRAGTLSTEPSTTNMVC